MTENEIAILIFFCVALGYGVGTLIQYLHGEPRCKHEYKEIVNDCFNNKRIVVYMCTKCGKRKVVKV